jgi:hypothetical protein
MSGPRCLGLSCFHWALVGHEVVPYFGKVRGWSLMGEMLIWLRSWSIVPLCG